MAKGSKSHAKCVGGGLSVTTVDLSYWSAKEILSSFSGNNKQRNESTLGGVIEPSVIRH